MSNEPTKSELTEQNEELKQQIELLQQRLQQLQELVPPPAISTEAETGELAGWLVTTPEPFTGMTAGVKFAAGRAIISVRRPDALQAVHRLMHDFGYKATPLSAAELHAALQQMASGLLPDAPEERSLAEKLAHPTFLN